jgi:hypothetical protein
MRGEIDARVEESPRAPREDELRATPSVVAASRLSSSRA